MVHPYPILCRSFEYRGRIDYFLTFKTHHRQPVFRDKKAVDLVLEQVQRAACKRGFEILVYCFMPDHLHLVISASHDDADAKMFFRLSKQYSGFYFAKEYNRRRLWQRYCHDRIIREDVELLDRIRYVVRNPVAAELVERPEDYAFWGSQRWTRDEILRICAEGFLASGLLPDSDL
jgi:REP element-mobilizing transposase RayT